MRGFEFQAGRGNGRARLRAFRGSVSATSVLALFELLAADPAAAQAPPSDGGRQTLPQINISAPRKRPPSRPSTSSTGPGDAGTAAAPAASPGTGAAATRGTAAPSPLNTNAVAESASRLGLTVRETPATVEVIGRQTMQDQGYRSNLDVAQGAVGVLSVDSGGAPAGFSMRGFQFGEVNILYDGIKIGPQSFVSRVMDTVNLDRIEFLKGPSSLMSGDGAIGGAVNYVPRQPISGPVQNEAFITGDSLGSIRSGFTSTGSTSLKGLDYYIGVGEARVNSFIDDVHKDLTNVSARFNYQASDVFKTFAAVEYRRDAGNTYWGTPLVPASLDGGRYATSGVVSGVTTTQAFDTHDLGAVTIDSRTLKTNYNVLDNSTSAQELWLRTGFEWALADNVTLKSQIYSYQAKRTWLDSETYGFDPSSPDKPANTIDRDRFFVSHDQKVFGNVTDLIWNSKLFGMENRLAAQLAASHNNLEFQQDFGGFPADTVDIVNPARGTYGAFSDSEPRSTRLNTFAGSLEDRLKITPTFALIGGVRAEALDLWRNAFSDGAQVANYPFSKTWTPVSYRAAYTWEPVRNLTFYSQYATAFDPAIATVFNIPASAPLLLTSSRTYETGVKQLFWDNKAEWTFSAFDIARRNVLVPEPNQTFSIAGEIATQGIEVAAAVRPIEGWKLWGNLAFLHTRYASFDDLTGKTPSNVAPIVANAGASYRYEGWRWPVEVGGSVRHVGARFLREDDSVTMDAYTVADAFMFVDIEKSLMLPTVDKTRLTFRVRNLTNKTYAAFSDSGYPDQVYLGAPRTYEMGVSFKF